MRFHVLPVMLLIVLLLQVRPGFAEKLSGGVGVQVVPVSTGELVVLHVIDGMPAAAAGLLPGDLLIEVDGKTLRGSDFDTVTRTYLWGESGSSVSLVWLRPGIVGPMRAEMTRVILKDKINVKPIPGVTITPPE